MSSGPPPPPSRPPPPPGGFVAGAYRAPGAHRAPQARYAVPSTGTLSTSAGMPTPSSGAAPPPPPPRGPPPQQVKPSPYDFNTAFAAAPSAATGTAEPANPPAPSAVHAPPAATMTPPASEVVSNPFAKRAPAAAARAPPPPPGAVPTGMQAPVTKAAETDQDKALDSGSGDSVGAPLPASDAPLGAAAPAPAASAPVRALPSAFPVFEKHAVTPIGAAIDAERHSGHDGSLPTTAAPTITDTAVQNPFKRPSGAAVTPPPAMAAARRSQSDIHTMAQMPTSQNPFAAVSDPPHPQPPVPSQSKAEAPSTPHDGGESQPTNAAVGAQDSTARPCEEQRAQRCDSPSGARHTTGAPPPGRVSTSRTPAVAAAPRGSSGSRARTQFDRLMKREVPAFLLPSSRTQTPRGSDAALRAPPLPPPTTAQHHAPGDSQTTTAPPPADPAHGDAPPMRTHLSPSHEPPRAAHATGAADADGAANSTDGDVFVEKEQPPVVHIPPSDAAVTALTEGDGAPLTAPHTSAPGWAQPVPEWSVSSAPTDLNTSGDNLGKTTSAPLPRRDEAEWKRDDKDVGAQDDWTAADRQHVDAVGSFPASPPPPPPGFSPDTALTDQHAPHGRPDALAPVLLSGSGREGDGEEPMNSASFFPQYTASESSPMSRAQSALPADAHFMPGTNTRGGFSGSDGHVLLAGEVLLNAADCEAAMGVWSPRSGAMEPTPPLLSEVGTGHASLTTPPAAAALPYQAGADRPYAVPSLPLRQMNTAAALPPAVTQNTTRPHGETMAVNAPTEPPATTGDLPDGASPAPGLQARAFPPPMPPQPTTTAVGGPPRLQQLTPRGRAPFPPSANDATPLWQRQQRDGLEGQRPPQSFAMSPYVRGASSAAADSPVPHTPLAPYEPADDKDDEDAAVYTVEDERKEDEDEEVRATEPHTEAPHEGAPAAVTAPLPRVATTAASLPAGNPESSTHRPTDVPPPEVTHADGAPGSHDRPSAALRPTHAGVASVVNPFKTPDAAPAPAPVSRPEPAAAESHRQEEEPVALPSTTPPPLPSSSVRERRTKRPYAPCFAVLHPHGGLMTVCANRRGALVRPVKPGATPRAAAQAAALANGPRGTGAAAVTQPTQLRLMTALETHDVSEAGKPETASRPLWAVRATEQGRAYAGLVRAVATTLPFFASTQETATFHSVEQVPSTLWAALQASLPSPMLEVLSSALEDALTPEVSAWQWSKGGGKMIAAQLDVAQKRAESAAEEKAAAAVEATTAAALPTQHTTPSRGQSAMRAASPRNAQWAAPSAPTPARTGPNRPHPAVGKQRHGDSEDDDDDGEDALLVIQRLLSQGARESAVEVALEHGLHTHAVIISMMCDSKDLYVKSIRAVVEKELEKSSPLAHAYCLFNELELPPFTSAPCADDDQDAPRQVLDGTWRVHAATLACNYTKQSAEGLVALGDSLLQVGLVMEAHTCFLIAHLTPQGSPTWRHGQASVRPLRPEQEQVMNALNARLGVLGGHYNPTTGCRTGFLSLTSTLLTDFLQEARLAADAAHASLVATVASNSETGVPRAHGLPARPRRYAVAFHVAQALWLAEAGLPVSAQRAVEKILSTLPPPQHALFQGPPAFLDELLFIFTGLPPPPPPSVPQQAAAPTTGAAPVPPVGDAQAPPQPPRAHTEADQPPQAADTPQPSPAAPQPAATAGPSANAPVRPVPAGRAAAAAAAGGPPPPPHASSRPALDGGDSRPPPLPMPHPPAAGVAERSQPSSPPTAGPPRRRDGSDTERVNPQNPVPAARPPMTMPPAATPGSPPPPSPPSEAPSQPPQPARGRGADPTARDKPAEKSGTAAKPARSRSVEALLSFFRRSGSADKAAGDEKKKKKDEAKPMILDTEKPPQYDPVRGRWMVEETEEEKAQAEMARRGPPKMPPRVADPQGGAPPAAQGPGVTAPPGASRPQAGPPPRRGPSTSVGRRQYVDMFNSA